MSLIELPVGLKNEAKDVRHALDELTDNELAATLLQVLDLLERGNRLSVGPAQGAVVSPQEAAEMTALSRTFICRLLDQGVIPEQPRVGSHRKILVSDLEDFMKNRQRASRQFATTLAHAEEAKTQLVRDIAGVSGKDAKELGY